jgi:hypothetical protein|tara:strand:+ start:329 stop:457 length:129 start_codon:yes stop_codon:yes gene_type:complete
MKKNSEIIKDNDPITRYKIKCKINAPVGIETVPKFTTLGSKE